MDDTIRAALSPGGTIDITTTGRRTGEPRRIEIVFHRIDGRMWISGIPSPRRRGWIANLAADPNLTVHLKGPLATADLPATARIVEDPTERRHVLERVARAWRRTDLDRMVDQSPLIEVMVDGTPTWTGCSSAAGRAAHRGNLRSGRRASARRWPGRRAGPPRSPRALPASRPVRRVGDQCRRTMRFPSPAVPWRRQPHSRSAHDSAVPGTRRSARPAAISTHTRARVRMPDQIRGSQLPPHFGA